MDLNEVPSDQMVNGVKIEKKKGGNYDAEVNGKLEGSRIKSIEAEQRCREVEENKLALELEIRNKDKDLETVKDHIRMLGRERKRIEEEIKGLKKKKAALGGEKVGEMMGGEFLLDEWDTESGEDSKLMVENIVLECEKSSALKEVEVWKQKCKELEARVGELEGKLKYQGKDGISIGIKGLSSMNGDDVVASRGYGSPSFLPGAMPMEGTPDKQCVPAVDNLTKNVHVKRQLAYRDMRCCDEKIAPPTPAGAKPSSAAVIDIMDSDNECDVHARHRSNSQRYGAHVEDGIMDVEEKNGGSGNTAPVMTPNRKRVRDLTVVTSDDDCENHEGKPSRRALILENSDNEGEDDDSVTPTGQVLHKGSIESDSDDDIPISQRKRKRAQGSSQPAGNLNPTRPRRRLVKYGESEQEDRAQGMEDHIVEDELPEDESESSVKDESESESESGSFIVDDSDGENVEDDVQKQDGGDDSDEHEDGSDSDLDYKEIISKFRSRRDPNSKWIHEGDMLSDFGKNPVMCMRAVCALYREQTNEEKAFKASLIHNKRGFSKFDATSGTRLGEFLTDGNPDCVLVKSVEELKEYNPYGLEECRRLANHYSKQLFKMYEEGVYDFFPQSPSSACSASSDDE